MGEGTSIKEEICKFLSLSHVFWELFVLRKKKKHLHVHQGLHFWKKRRFWHFQSLIWCQPLGKSVQFKRGSRVFRASPPLDESSSEGGGWKNIYLSFRWKRFANVWLEESEPHYFPLFSESTGEAIIIPGLSDITKVACFFAVTLQL